MKRWEYYIVWVRTHLVGQKLNELGELGWELSYIDKIDMEFRLILKRPVIHE